MSRSFWSQDFPRLTTLVPRNFGDRWLAVKVFDEMSNLRIPMAGRKFDSRRLPYARLTKFVHIALRKEDLWSLKANHLEFVHMIDALLISMMFEAKADENLQLLQPLRQDASSYTSGAWTFPLPLGLHLGEPFHQTRDSYKIESST